MSDYHVLLRGVVGSTAYGLAREGSDVDRLGVFVAPTTEVAGLKWHDSKATQHGTSDQSDYTLHEVGKFCRLALKCNPSLMELLWLPSDLYDQVTEYGVGLMNLRHAFLFDAGVRNAYGGYAHQQATRLRNRGDGSFSADTRKRTAKHGRHLLRLLRQGRELLETGMLTVRVQNAEEYWEFDNYTADEMLTVYDREKQLFDSVTSVLPLQPDFARVDDWLKDVRLAYMDYSV